MYWVQLAKLNLDSHKIRKKDGRKAVLFCFSFIRYANDISHIGCDAPGFVNDVWQTDNDALGSFNDVWHIVVDVQSFDNDVLHIDHRYKTHRQRYFTAG